MKSVDKTNPVRWRDNDSPVRLTELFLDFDPVAPEAPKEDPHVSLCDDEHQALSGDATAVTDDFQRLKAASDLHL